MKRNRGFKGYKAWFVIYETKPSGQLHIAGVMAKNLRQAKQRAIDELVAIKEGRHINGQPLPSDEHITMFKIAPYHATKWISLHN